MKRPEWTRRKPKTQRPTAATAPAMGGLAKGFYYTSIALSALVVIVITGAGFAHSYDGLHGWGLDHGMAAGWKADSFPLLVDLFIAVGELGLFQLALEAHRLESGGMAVADLLLPLTIAAGGWSASLAFNVGHVKSVWTWQLTAGVAPLASMLGLFVLLRTLHRFVTRQAAASAPGPELAHQPETPGSETDPASLDEDQSRATGEEDDTAAQEPVLTLPEALRAATRGGWTGRQIAKELSIKNRKPLYAMLRQADPDGDQSDDDTADSGTTPPEGGSGERPDAEYYAGELALDVAKVQAILDNRSDLAPAGAINGHPVSGAE